MGPLTPAVGDLVATPRGYKSLALEGFSEDLNEDGFVDPIAQAAVPVATYQLPEAPVAVQNVVGAGTYTIDHGEVSSPRVHAYTHAAPVVTANVGGAAPAVHTYVFKAPAVAVYSGFRGNWKNPEVAAIWNSRSFRAPAVVNWYSRPQVLVVDDESKVAAPRPAPLPIAPTVQHVGYNVHQPAPAVVGWYPIQDPAVAAYNGGSEAPDVVKGPPVAHSV